MRILITRTRENGTVPTVGTDDRFPRQVKSQLGSDRYRILSQLRYRPGMLESGVQPETIDAMIYDDLASGHVDPIEAHMWFQSAEPEEE